MGVAKLKKQKAAGADGQLGGFMQYRGEGMMSTMVMLCIGPEKTRDGEISTHLDIHHGVAQECASLLTLSKAFATGIIVAVEVATTGDRLWQVTASRLLFADDFVRISETPGGYLL